MAFYVSLNDLRCDENLETGPYRPGVEVPRSGIYRCKNCRNEIAANQGDPFPPEDHHQHQVPSPITWELIVATERVRG